MFEIGDLVRFRTEGIVTILRNNPTKKIGLIVDISSGDMDDRITVVWLGTDIKEVMPEFYLIKVA